MKYVHKINAESIMCFVRITAVLYKYFVWECMATFSMDAKVLLPCMEIERSSEVVFDLMRES